MNSDQTKRSNLNAASWLLLLLTVGLIAYVGSDVIQQSRAVESNVIAELVDIPFLTDVAVSTPAWAIKAICGVLIFVLAVKELLFRWPTLRLVLNLTALVAVFFLWEAFRAAIMSLYV